MHTGTSVLDNVSGTQVLDATSWHYKVDSLNCESSLAKEPYQIKDIFQKN